jgi:hypothetical protein
MIISWRLKGVSGDFATASNWDPAAVPGPADDVIIGAKGTYTVTSSVAETVDSLTISNKHATLLIEGASSFSDTLGGVNDGTIVVDSGSSILVGTTTPLNPTLSNAGTIDLNDSTLTIGRFGASMGSLLGAGHINMSGGGIEGTFAMTLVTDNTISGAGFINPGGGAQGTGTHWNNQGVIDASTPNGILAIGHTTIENSGILEATNGGELDLFPAAVHNTAAGIIEAKGANSQVFWGFSFGADNGSNAGLIAAVDSGTVLLRDKFGLDNTDGTIEAGHDSTVGLENVTILGGSVTVRNGGTIESEPEGSSQAPSTITGAVVTNAGTVGAEGANLTIIGNVTNTGTLDANNATLVIEGAVSGGKATLEGTGEIEFGAASAAHVTFAANSNAILKLDNPLSFTGTVSGLTTGDYIDLTNINFADNPTLSFSSKTHVLTVTDSVSQVTDFITFKGAIGSFSAQSDGNGGTYISDPPATVTASHDEPIDFSHPGGELRKISAALTGQAHVEGTHLIAAPDATAWTSCGSVNRAPIFGVSMLG